MTGAIMQEYLSNLYINYFYGSYISLGAHWGAHDVVWPFSKVYYITDGECVLEIEGVRYVAKPGDFFLIPAGTRHSYYHENENYVTKYWFHFDFKIGGSNFTETISAPYFHHFGYDKKLVAMFRKIFRLEKKGTISTALEMTSTILQMMSYYFSATVAKESQNDDESTIVIRNTISYIHDNLHRNITVEELAEIAHFHPNYFVRFFKEKLGIPPAKYINNIKIEMAKSLLETTDLPVHKVMQAVGFKDYSHFSKYFKNHSGYSPKAFRRYYTKKTED